MDALTRRSTNEAGLECPETERETDQPFYDLAMVAHLPEVARRYFAQAIEPGTPLRRVVRLEMAGTFIMNANDMPMRARQILAPPGRGFVWQAEIGAGLLRLLRPRLLRPRLLRPPRLLTPPRRLHRT
jgi:hypothetical protein